MIQTEEAKNPSIRGIEINSLTIARPGCGEDLGNRRIRNIFVSAFLMPVFLVKPIFDIYWDSSVLGVQANWLPYIWIVVGFAICHRSLAVNRMGLTLTVGALIAVSLQVIGGQSVDPANIFRTLVSIIPLVIVIAVTERSNGSMLDSNGINVDGEWRKRLIKFLFLYGLCLLPNLIILIQQIIGVVPVLDFDVIEGELIPRYSGAYMKPNNLAFTWFPLFIGALCLMRCEKKISQIWICSTLLMGAVFIATVQLIGLRTFESILFASVVIFYLSRRNLSVMVRILKFSIFTYPLFLLGIFIVFGNFLDEGILRGRTNAWVQHLQFYMDSSISDQLFGKGRVSISNDVDMGAFAEEFHNDFGRILITHGFLGLLLYLAAIRAFFLFAVCAFHDNHVLMRANVAGITGLLMYSTTNEPTYYPWVFWSFFIIPILMIGYAKIITHKTIEVLKKNVIMASDATVKGSRA